MMQTRLPDILLFDLDDTILSHTDGIDELWRDLCYEHAAYIEGLDFELLYEKQKEKSMWFWSDQQRHRIGRNNLKETRRKLITEVFSELGIKNLEVAHSLADSFTVQREDLVTLYPWSLDTLKELRKRNIRLGMITNGAYENQKLKIDKFELEQYFDCISIEGGFGSGKPDAAIFHHTLKQLDANPEDAWMIGDDLHRDILGAERAGIYSVWIDIDEKGLPENPASIPDKIIKSIDELLLT